MLWFVTLILIFGTMTFCGLALEYLEEQRKEK